MQKMFKKKKIRFKLKKSDLNKKSDFFDFFLKIMIFSNPDAKYCRKS